MLALLSMLSATVTKLSKEDCKVYSDLLVDIFLTCLDYRTQETKVCVRGKKVHCAIKH